MQLSGIWMPSLVIWAYDVGQVEDNPSGPRPQPQWSWQEMAIIGIHTSASSGARFNGHIEPITHRATIGAHEDVVSALS